jgi:hypothetical protein
MIFLLSPTDKALLIRNGPSAEKSAVDLLEFSNATMESSNRAAPTFINSITSKAAASA